MDNLTTYFTDLSLRSGEVVRFVSLHPLPHEVTEMLQRELLVVHRPYVTHEEFSRMMPTEKTNA